MNVSFDIDDQRVIDALEKMTAKSYRGALRSGLRSSIQPIRRAAVSNFKRHYPESEKTRIMAIKNYKKGIGVYLGLFKKRAKAAEVRAIIALRSLNRGRAGYKYRKGARKGQPEQGLHFWDDAVIQNASKVEQLTKTKIIDAVKKKAAKEMGWI